MKTKLLCTLLFIGVSFWTKAQTFTFEGLNYNITDATTKTVEVGDNITYAGTATIPATVTDANNVTYKVTAIADTAFSLYSNGNLDDNESLTGVDLSGATNLVSIGASAFHYCRALRGELTIPDTVTSIGEKAFAFVLLTGSLILPSSLTSIGEGAFGGCKDFTGSLTIPDGVTSIGGGAFFGCTGLTGNLTIPNSVTSIGVAAFSGCTGFTGNLTLGSSLNTIGDGAFYGLTGITNVIVKNSEAVAINANVFQSGEVSSPSFYASDLSLEVPYESFYNYKEAAVWKDFKTITKTAFSGQSITVDGIIYNILNTTDNTVEVGRNTGYTGNAVIPATVTDANNVTYKVTGIADGAFFPGWGEVGEGLTDIDLSGAIYLKSIGGLAFTGARMTSVILPNSVKYIEPFAFQSCALLTSVFLSNSLTSIGESAFQSCFLLTSVVLSNSLTSIGENVFEKSGLKHIIVINTSPFSIDTAVFEGVNLSDISLEVSSGAVDAYKEAAVWQDFKFVTEVATIGAEFLYEGLKYRVTNLYPRTVTVADNTNYIGQNIEIPNTVNYATDGVNNIEYAVTNIEEQAFNGNTNITGSLTLGENITNIGGAAFSGCTGLTGSLTIPNAVTTIGGSAFSGCTGFTGSLSLGGNITNIGGAAFYGCTGLTGSLTIPNAVTTIGGAAFSGCTGFTGSLTLGSSLNSIGIYAFYDLTNISDVEVKNTVPVVINANIFQSGDVGSPSFYGSNISLTVPQGSSDAYINQVVWKDFKFIGELNFTVDGINYKITDITNKTVEVGDNTSYNSETLILSATTVTHRTEVFKVTKIGDNAFKGNTVLTSVDLSLATNLKTIGTSAFEANNIKYDSGGFGGTGHYYYETNLTELNLGGSVLSIEDKAFFGCHKLESITIPNTVTSIGTSAFEAAKDYEYTSTIGYYSNTTYYESSLIELNLGNSLVSIGDRAFYGCKKLENITIPEGVINIGSSAFGAAEYVVRATYQSYSTIYETSLTELNLGKSLASIGDKAFYQAHKLTNVTVKNTTAININSTVFDGVTLNNASLGIPYGALYSYQEAPVWKDFKDITSAEATLGMQLVYEDLKYTITGLSPKTVAVADNTDYVGENVEIPTTFSYGAENDEYAVTSISQYAFNGNTNITGSLTLGENITSIEGAAFYGCTGFTGSLTIPDGVTTIDGAAFSGCTGFTGNLTLGNSLHTIGIYAFYDLTGITNVAVKNSTPVVINANVFQSGEVSSPNFYASDLSLELVNGGLSTYRETPVWKDFKSITGPTIIVGGLVYNIVDAINHTVELGDNTTYEGVTVSIPETVTDPSTDVSYKVIGIAKNAFKDNTHIAYLNIAATVGLESIGESAFSGCTVLSGALSLPVSVTSIGAHAFSGCVGITSVSVRNEVPVAIQANVFEGLSLDAIPLNVPNAAAKTAYEGTSVWSDFKTISVPGFTVGGLVYTIVDPINYTVEVGDNSSFADSFLSIPDSVTDPNTGSSGDGIDDGIDDGGFGGDDGYGGGYDDGFGGGYDDGFGGGYDDGGLGDGGDLGEEGGSSITYNVIGISANAFKDNTNITYLDVSAAASLKSIGASAFSGCSELTGDLSIPSLVTSIGASAFSGCSKFSGALTLPSLVTNIGEAAFSGCVGFTSVSVENPIPVNIHANVFEGLTLGNIKLNVSNGTAIAAYATAAVWKDFSPIVAPTFTFEGIAYNVTDLVNKTVELGDNVSFEGTTVSIPATVSDGQTTYTITSIAKDAFKQNSNITSLDLSNATLLTTMGQESFSGCTSLTTVSLPDSLTNMDDFVFGGCSSLKSIVLPDSITSLGNAIFASCTSLTSAVIGNLVTELKSSVFNNCSSLVNVTVGSSVTSIGTYTFSGCTSLVNVTVKNPTPIAGLNANVFSGLSLETITLKVPSMASKELYEVETVWEDFRVCVSITIDNLDFNVTDETNNTVELGYNSSYTGEVEVPATITSNGKVYKVTSIAKNAFKNNTEITSIDLSSATDLETIEASAFENCTNLEEVNIPEWVKIIEAYAFADTSNLEHVTFGKQNTESSSPSAKVTSQNSVNKTTTTENSLTTIGDYAFASSGIVSITIPETVTSIGEGAFANCNDLETVIVENSTPVDISGKAVFDGLTLSEIALRTPSTESKELYEAAAVWSEFDFSEETISVKEQLLNESLSIIFKNNSLEISTNDLDIVIKDVQLLNTLGAVLSRAYSTSIVTDHLSSGVYILRVNTSKGNLVKKIVKQ